MQQQDKRNLIEVTQLIDLTDKPIGLTQDEISWSRVKSTGSNCICCCCNNSVTLVTTNDSYILDHVPLDSIQFAQTNASLQQLALSNHRRLVIIDLVDNGSIKNNTAPKFSGNRRRSSADHCQNQHQQQQQQQHSSKSEIKVVNIAASGLTMNDIVFWRWIDDTTLAILSHEALYTCQVNQQQINHHALTALASRSRYLTMERVFEVHPNLVSLCQITDIQRDHTGNLYAISGLYSRSSLLEFRRDPIVTMAPGSGASNESQQTGADQSSSKNQISSSTATNSSGSTSSYLRSRLLRPTFGSVPSRLSQMVSSHLGQQSLDDNTDHHLDLSFDLRRVQLDPNHQHDHHLPSSSTGLVDEKAVCGLVQVYCKTRDRSQLIGAHAITFTKSYRTINNNQQDEQSCDSSSNLNPTPPTILVAAIKTPKNIKVHFIEMNNGLERGSSNGHSASASTRLKGANNHADFPTWIVCSRVNCDNNAQLHVAMMTTKFGRLVVCSVTHSTILFSTNITQGIISSSILESKTNGLMVICRNGQVLLVRLNTARILRLLDETKTLRHISSSHNLLSSLSPQNRDSNNNNSSSSSSGNPHNQHSQDTDSNNLSSSLDIGLEVLMSTKL